jgi:uncharacterized protein (DUF305 family)
LQRETGHIYKLNIIEMKLSVFKIVILSVIIVAGCSTGGYTKKEAKFWNNIGRNTVFEMENYNKTGDPDYDFANLMEIHHRAGIAMANNEVDFGLDTALTSLAKQIIKEQEKDNVDLSSYLLNNSPRQESNDFNKELKEFLKLKKNEATKELKLSGITDKDFANIMVNHHLQAMELSAMELKYGRAAEVKDVAKRIMDSQEKELDLLRVKATSRE